MKDKVGIWIDHRKAVIVSTSGDLVTARTLESKVGPHSRYSGRAGSPTPEGPQDAGGEKKYEERYGQALLILGPGEAKLQLKERLSRSKTLSGCIVEIETTDKLADAQIVATVKEHYGIAH